MSLRSLLWCCFASSLVACSGGLADPPPDAPSAPPAKTDPAPAPTTSSSPPTSPPSAAGPGLVGVFHHGELAATNLALRADHTFTWTTESSCGVVAGQCGTWKATSSGVELVAAVGDRLRWIDTGEPMRSVVVHETREGVEVTGITLDDVTLHQTWDLGRMCPVCRGGPGPATQAKCEAPLPNAC